jgi:hypothetical protein
MSRKGQRQDVAFLALAVAVLAIAVALFVGIRSLSNRGAVKPPAAAPEQVAQKPPVIAPPGSKSHDPFKGKPVLPAKPAVGANAKAKPAEQIKLVGVIQGQDKELLATIRRGSRRYYAKRGDTIAGYTVSDVETSRVVLTKGTEKLTLSLHHSSDSEPEKR